jgi:hypothetical protein
MDGMVNEDYWMFVENLSIRKSVVTVFRKILRQHDTQWAIPTPARLH